MLAPHVPVMLDCGTDLFWGRDRFQTALGSYTRLPQLAQASCGAWSDFWRAANLLGTTTSPGSTPRYVPPWPMPRGTGPNR